MIIALIKLILAIYGGLFIIYCIFYFASKGWDDGKKRNHTINLKILPNEKKTLRKD